MCSDDSTSDLRRDYDGFLIVEDLSPSTATAIRALGGEARLLDVYDNAIELRYEGRDSSRNIVRMLCRIAELVGDAKGEVQCQVSGNVGEMWFEYYRIHGGRLFVQCAQIVREPEHEVRPESLPSSD